jgi:Pentapeptide repeats (8 copies)
MANAQHLEILQRGVAQWNKWRRYHPNIRPDLSGDELPGELDDIHFLVEAVVNEVEPGRAPADDGGLSGAVLNGINFRRANLANARLDSAMLIEANLSAANLRGPSLASCILTGAKMTGIDARGANFNAGVQLLEVLLRQERQYALLERPRALARDDLDDGDAGCAGL